VDASSAHADFRFYAELNDHLPEEWRYKTVQRSFFVPGNVKDMIESCGVPHTEVELVVANGKSVDFSYLVRDGDRIAVYPMFESIDIRPELLVRPAVLRNLKFVIDVHLGRLAAYLRMLGFDALYQNSLADCELARISSEQRRVLLTRDRGLLKHTIVTHGYWLRETDSRRQLAEVVARFDLARSIRPFSRCMTCNSPLQEVSKDQVRDRLPRRTAELHDRFHQCPQCCRVYWAGSHHRRMQHWIRELTGSAGETAQFSSALF
jgi:hypothetical protein